MTVEEFKKLCNSQQREYYNTLKSKKEKHSTLMSHRVTEDVKINIALWEDCLNYLKELYENDYSKIESYIRFLAEVMQIVADQETYGIKLDIDKCKENLSILTNLAEEKIKILKTVMPKIPNKVKRQKPNSLCKKDGELTEAGKRWKRLTDGCNLPLEYEGYIEEIVSWYEPNPVSVSQVKSYLFSLNWNPEIYVETINTKGEVKQVEQIKNKDKNLCKSV